MYIYLINRIINSIFLIKQYFSILKLLNKIINIKNQTLCEKFYLFIKILLFSYFNNFYLNFKFF